MISYVARRCYYVCSRKNQGENAGHGREDLPEAGDARTEASVDQEDVPAGRRGTVEERRRRATRGDLRTPELLDPVGRERRHGRAGHVLEEAGAVREV
jgi:hypothetical protein